jgi:hypothetical protein
LAALLPDDIKARLKATGKLSSRAEIEGWDVYYVGLRLASI